MHTSPVVAVVVLPDETAGPQPRAQGLSYYRPLGAPSLTSCGKMRDPGNEVSWTGTEAAKRLKEKE